MLRRPYRASFENLEKREVFSAGALAGLYLNYSSATAIEIETYAHFANRSITVSGDRTESVGKNESITGVGNDGNNQGIWLPGNYLAAAPESQPLAISGNYDASTGVLTAVNRRIGPEIHDLKAAPESGPSAVFTHEFGHLVDMKAAYGSGPSASKATPADSADGLRAAPESGSHATNAMRDDFFAYASKGAIWGQDQETREIIYR